MTLEAIKDAVEHLPEQAQRELLQWLEEREQADWDAQLQRDFSRGGRGMPLVEIINADIQAGKFKAMDGRGPAERK